MKLEHGKIASGVVEVVLQYDVVVVEPPRAQIVPLHYETRGRKKKLIHKKVLNEKITNL